MVEEYNTFPEGACVYKPPGEWKPEAIPATLGVKFCQDTMLMKSFLDQHNISYTDGELEMTPLGLALRVKKEDVCR